MASQYQFLPQVNVESTLGEFSRFDFGLSGLPSEQPRPPNSQCSSSKHSPVRAPYLGFLWLFITTICSTALFAMDRSYLTFSGDVFNKVAQNRASIQIFVQLAASSLGIVQVAAVCRLFNYSTRTRLVRSTVPLGTLSFWSGISSASMRWELAWGQFILLLFFVSVGAIPAALWAGALTPVSTFVSHSTTVNVPQYSNTTLVREWPPDIAKAGPIYRSDKGLFTYSPGISFEALLSRTLASATTRDGSPRLHRKYDNSYYTYVGRSYGVGSSVGLVDDHILNNTFTTSYTFDEVGYVSETTCVYNETAEFSIIPNGPVGGMLYAAQGYLPDSRTPEFSIYVGNTSNAIVAIGVTANNRGREPRYLGIAAGSSYRNLNKVECKTSFTPASFKIYVDVVNLKIETVSTERKVPDFEPSGNLTHALMRQFELYSNDLTNLYQSVLGNSLESSIANYEAYVSSSHYIGPNPSKADVSLKGIENSLTAMIDDLLVLYASSQLMIANDTVSARATTTTLAVQLGQSIYIIAIFVINWLVLLAVGEEAVRTYGWKGLVSFDYNDLSSLAVASSRGGKNVAEAVATESPAKTSSRCLNSEWFGNQSAIRTLVMLQKTDAGFCLIAASPD